MSQEVEYVQTSYSSVGESSFASFNCFSIVILIVCVPMNTLPIITCSLKYRNLG